MGSRDTWVRRVSERLSTYLVRTSVSPGFTSVALLICNRIIGTGIFATPALILQSAGSVGSSLLLWLVGACIAGAGTAVFVEFGTAIPRSGGEKNYLTFLYPRPAYLVPSAYAAYATLMGWAAGNSIICGEYILHALGVPVNSWNQRLIGAVCLTAATLLHGTSLRWGLRVQNSFATFKLVVLAAIALAGLAVLTRILKLDGDALDNFKSPFRGSNTSVNALATGLYKVVWSFVGYANANAALSEVKDPVKTIRRAAPLAILTVAALYIAVNLAYFSVVPKEEMMEGGTVIAAQFFRHVLGDSAESILSLCIALSAFGAVLSVLFAHGRINQENARDGLIPFSTVIAQTSSFRTPLAGLVVHWTACMAILIAAPPGDAYNMVINVISYPSALVNAAISGGLIILYHPTVREQWKWQPAFRAGLPATLFYFLGNVFLVIAPLVPPAQGTRPYKNLPYWLHVVVGIAVLIVGGIYWLFWCIILPRIRHYSLSPTTVVQPDGQTITIFVKRPKVD
ncbi:amino acid transporter [Auricularia subglabra TFB-10046 SS5]|nr:amino acid transporter [Auricularia subglabra TFB-10046 SS5]